MTRLTRQGVRDLNLVGPRPVVRRSPPVCVHDWSEAYCDGSCDYNYSCTCPGLRCRKCNEVRRG